MKTLRVELAHPSPNYCNSTDLVFSRTSWCEDEDRSPVSYHSAKFIYTSQPAEYLQDLVYRLHEE